MRRLPLAAGLALLALAGCSQPFDADLRGFGNGFNTANAVRQPLAARPRPDDRGIIAYPNYQVAVARDGDTVADVAGRVGLPPAELAAFNGLPADVGLRGGELLVLPRPAGPPLPGAGTAAPGAVDVATLAGAAIARSDPGAAVTALPPVQTGVEPLRHRVQRGETAFTIARLYDVSVRSLADWNGLGPDMAVREGQYLLIPVAAAGTSPAPVPVPVAAPPGAGSLAPAPPSAATPLPDPEPAAPPPAAAPASPALSEARTEASDPGRLMMPVAGSIIRPFDKGRNDGIGIAAAAGTPVRAAGDGTVAAITLDIDQVPILVLRHEGNLLTVYAGLDQIAVEKGDTVKRGDPIAQVGAGDPAFLHFEVREGFDSVDPIPYLN